MSDYSALSQPDVVPYFAMPMNYHGNQLKSYGGYLRYSVRHSNRGRPLPGPSVIISVSVLNTWYIVNKPHLSLGKRLHFTPPNELLASSEYQRENRSTFL